MKKNELNYIKTMEAKVIKNSFYKALGLWYKRRSDAIPQMKCTGLLHNPLEQDILL
jgi:hypothetical protein